MTDLASSLHSWLDHLDSTNELGWYQHVVSREFLCGCKLPSTYCTEWKPIVTPPVTTKANSAWIHTNSTPVSDALIALEAPRRRYIVLNAWESHLIPKLKARNPDCMVLAYKCLSSTRSNDPNPNWTLLPAGVSYQWANTNRPEWFLLKGGRRVQWSYAGHWQMDIGHPNYQAMWAQNVAKVKALGFDGVWMDNCLWKRSAYSIYPDKYTTDHQLREAYRSALRAITPVLKSAGLVTIGNLNDAREVANGWASYLDSGLDGGFDEFWLSVADDGNDLLPEYEQGWKRQVDEIAYAESKGKIAIVQPHFPVGNVRAFRYCLASYLMAYAGKAAIVEANGRDQYGNPTAWHPEYDWDLGAPSGVYRMVGTNIFRRDFTKATVVVNANPTSTGPVTIQLGGVYLNEGGVSVASVSLPGTSGAILRKVS
jgi:hypothetical protein